MTDRIAHVLGVDPGREKTGLALLDEKGAILWRAIVAPSAVGAQLEALCNEWNFSRIALGDSTASAPTRTQIEAVLGRLARPPHLEIVDEHGSTLEARALYWQAHPPRGWRRLIPLSLQTPDEPLDDFAAAVIARRALSL